VSQLTGDIVIAAAMCYVLRDKSRGIPANHGTRSVVTVLFHYTLTTGVLTSCAAAAYLIAYLMSSHTMIYIGIFFAHVYTNSLMASLNSRKSLRAMAHASEEKRFDINVGGAFIPTPRPDSDTSNPRIIPQGQQGYGGTGVESYPLTRSFSSFGPPCNFSPTSVDTLY
jgi:hypothetical protein